MLEKFEARIAQIAQALEQSAANHHGLLGAMAEVRAFYEVYKQDLPITEEVIKDMVEVASDVAPLV